MRNTDGMNISASPLFLKDGESTGQSYNYDYATTGAINKVLASSELNVSPNAQLRTLGLGQYHDVTSDSRTLIRVAGTKIQTVNTTTGAITDVTDDTTAAGNNFPVSGNTQPVVFAPFNTVGGITELWMAGGGMPTLEGYYGSKVTANGTATPTGSIGVVVTPSDGGTFPSAGTYYYAIQYRKRSTQTFSNVALDVLATISAGTDSVTLSWTLTNIDTTLYDQVWIWRSAFGGSSNFTTGSIIAKLVSTVTTYKDQGSSIADAQVTPRPGNTIKDNSPLPVGTYKYVTTFKRRLITASGSTLYLSDLNLPESWPLTNTITLPTGGPITALGVIGVPSEYTTGADEYLCIWKERELWVLTGEDLSTWTLLFVDKTGCAGQSLVVQFNSFVGWMTYNGIYIWDGRGRPARISRPLAALFAADGDLDKTTLNQGCAVQYEKGNEVIWRVSHKVKGKNQLSIKMDTRLTSEAAASNLQNPEMAGVFIFDTDANPYYAMVSFRPTSQDEILISGDSSGFVYKMYSSATSAVQFDYETKPLDQDNPQTMKRYKRVIVFAERLTVSDLTLFYWTDYRVRDEYRSTVVASMAPSKGTQPALWDIALWDQALWDDYTPDIAPIEFNLHSYENNAEGLSLKLRFEQMGSSAPVRIHGFAVEWEEQGNLPIPTQQI